MFPVGFLIVYDILGVLSIGNMNALVLLRDLAYSLIFEGIFMILAFLSYIELSRAYNPEDYNFINNNYCDKYICRILFWNDI